MDALDLTLAGLAAVMAGAVNAMAGGGTLISFPALLALGVPAVAANVTNTVALCPGYLGATLTQKNDLKGQGPRLRWLLPAGLLGGVAGAVLLLYTGERMFRALVPYLILLASALLAVQEPLRRRIQSSSANARERTVAAVLPVALASVYGGYFGAGLSVIILASLGLVLDDNLTRLNALKQAIAFSVNIAAAVYFLFSHQVIWSAAVVMAVGSLLGGAMGGRLASRVPPALLRRIVVAIGVTVGIAYLL